MKEYNYKSALVEAQHLLAEAKERGDEALVTVLNILMAGCREALEQAVRDRHRYERRLLQDRQLAERKELRG